MKFVSFSEEGIQDIASLIFVCRIVEDAIVKADEYNWGQDRIDQNYLVRTLN